MKIETKEKTVKFTAIRHGECFKRKGNYYMRTAAYGDINAVNLDGGYLVYVNIDEEVEPVKLKMVKE